MGASGAEVQMTDAVQKASSQSAFTHKRRSSVGVGPIVKDDEVACLPTQDDGVFLAQQPW